MLNLEHYVLVKESLIPKQVKKSDGNINGTRFDSYIGFAPIFKQRIVCCSVLATNVEAKKSINTKTRTSLAYYFQIEITVAVEYYAIAHILVRMICFLDF